MVISPKEIKLKQQDKAEEIEKTIDNILVKAKNLENIIIESSIFNEVNSDVKEKILDKYKKAGWDITYSGTTAYDPQVSPAYIFKQKKNGKQERD